MCMVRSLVTPVSTFELMVHDMIAMVQGSNLQLKCMCSDGRCVTDLWLLTLQHASVKTCVGRGFLPHSGAMS